MTVKLVVPFAEIREDDLALVGGKAHSLGTLRAAGFEVPDGFALTTEALKCFIESGALAPELRTIEERVAAGGLSLHESWEFLGQTRQRIVDSPLPPEVERALVAAYREQLGPDAPVAVRSSGAKEDLEGASFAGQYETFLNVRGEAALRDAVKRCWASIWRNRVLQYSHRKAGGAKDLWMSVAVQRMVDADVSGVLFTVNPTTGREREALVEAVFGLGEALVSGKVNADRYVVDVERGEALSTEINVKSVRVVPLPEGRTETGPTGGKVYTREEKLTESGGRKPTLGAPELRSLAELARAVQEHYGRPMDVEWILSQGKLFTVQARPITTLHFAPDFGEWTTADLRDGGVSSDVCSPFMWSIYGSVMQHTLPQYSKDIKLIARDHEATWVQMFFARGYWNLGEVKRALERVPGYVERNFDLDLGVDVRYEGPGKRTPVTVRGVLGALPVLFALKRHYREQIARDRALVAAFEERARPFDLDAAGLAALDRPALGARYRELLTKLYFETDSNYFYTLYNTSNSKLDFKVHFEKAKRACRGALEYLHLVGGLEDLSHVRPLRDLHALCARLRREGRAVDDATVREFARRWRHHGQREMDIRAPRWPEDLDHVRGTLERALAAFDPSQDPDAHARAGHVRYLAERGKALRALRRRPLARRAFRKGLELVRTYAWWKEEMRDRSTFCFYLVRIWSLEVARRLVAEGVLEREDDVWYLGHEEVLAAFDGALGRDEARRRVRRGRQMVRSFRNFKNPNEIGNRYEFAEAAAAPAAEGALRGTACSPGRVEGPAKVVRSLDEARKVERGDILVTVFTDPGWTPLLALVGAVVTETGGLLSHAAVIAREYGIPAVLAVPRATETIRDGDRLAVDGTAGTVEVIGAK